MRTLSKLAILFGLMVAVAASHAAEADPKADREWKGVLAKGVVKDDPEWTLRITYKPADKIAWRVYLNTEELYPDGWRPDPNQVGKVEDLQMKAQDNYQMYVVFLEGGKKVRLERDFELDLTFNLTGKWVPAK